MAGFSHNLKIAANDKETKLLKNAIFDPDSFIDEKIGNATLKLHPKALIYHLSQNGYATIVKADESEDSYLCRLRIVSGAGGVEAAKDVKSTAEELTKQIKI